MKHLAGPLLATAEMPLWTHDGPPPAPVWDATDYGTGLEPYVPFWAQPGARLPQPYARRVEHEARHFPKPGKAFAKWARSAAREVGEFFVGAFQPVKEAW